MQEKYHQNTIKNSIKFEHFFFGSTKLLHLLNRFVANIKEKHFKIECSAIESNSSNLFNFFESLKVASVNIVAILVMPVKSTTLGLLK